MKRRTGKKPVIKSKHWLILTGVLLLSVIGTFLIRSVTEEEETVEASTVVSAGDFTLTAENRWDAANAKNYAELNWDSVADLSQSGYQLYQSEDGSNWSIRSLHYEKAIKVLNVYPDVGGSNTLKSWMDSLGLKDADGNNLIQVTPVTMTAFNTNPTSYLLDGSGEYQYDVVMFGSWDSNYSKDLSAAGLAATKDFIAAGRGVLFGHDTVAWINPNFLDLKSVLGVDGTYNLRPEEEQMTGGKTIQVVNDGYLMKYPFELPNQVVLTIPESHNVQLSDKHVGTTWIKFIAPLTKYNTSYVWEDDDWTAGWYLKTNENVGMIQTGHSQGASTEDERKVIANTLYNLAQVSYDTHASDQTVKDDQAPEIPTASIRCGKTGSLNIKVNAVDVGKEYQWYVQANTKTSGTLTSDVVSETIISNTAGYFYEVTDSPTSTLQAAVEAKKDSYGRIAKSDYDVYVAPDDDSVEYETTTTFTINEVKKSGRYLHIVAVDRSNNVSLVSTTELTDLLQYVDFEVERTGDEAKLVELNLDSSLDATQKSVEIQIPTNAVIKDFDSLTLPTDWYAFENSETTDYRSFTFAMEDNNDLATIQAFLEDLRFTMEAPVNQAGTIRLVFHEKVYTSYEHPDGTTHYYTYVEGTINWLEAYNAAKKMTYKGLEGYLPTLTAQEEHEFVYNNIAKMSGWLGGTRMVQSTGQKITDQNKISTNISDYLTDTTNGHEWYWASGPEAGLVFFDKATYAMGGQSPAGVYNGFNNAVNGGTSSEPNNSPSEYVLEFAQNNGYYGNYWNDLAYNQVNYKTGYYVEFSVYGDQVEGTEITDVCWAADVPQKISLKAYDQNNNALSEGDQLFDQALRIGQSITITPVTIAMHDFLKAVNMDDTTHSLTYTVGSEYQEGKLLYANRTVDVHVRQVIVNKNTNLVAPSAGYGKLISQRSDGTLGEEFSVTMISSENNSESFTDYQLRYQANEPIYGFAPTIPEYYQLVGYVLTTTNQQHLPADSTTADMAVDVSQEPEFWLTIYIEQSKDQPNQYSWDYKENLIGSISVS